MNQLRRFKDFVNANRYPLALFLASRIGLLICVYIGLVLMPVREGEGFWRAASDNLFLDGFARWDSGWYIDIAKNGYLNTGSQRDTAFFPAYPLLLSLARNLGDTWLAVWGMALSNSLFCCGLCLTFQLTKSLLSEKTSRLAVALLAFAPASIFFSSVYTESLFFASTAFSFWLAKKGRLYPAMAAAAIASTTRVVGFFCVPFAYAYFHSTTTSAKTDSPVNVNFRPRSIARLLSALAVGFSPIAIHLLYLRIRFGDFMEFVQSQKDWSGVSSAWILRETWQPILGLQIDRILAGELALMNMINLVALLLSAVVIVIGFAKRLLPLPLLLWALLTVLTSFSVWTSGLRYVSAVFPVAMLLAFAFRRLPVEIVIGCSAMAMALFAITFSHWYWVA